MLDQDITGERLMTGHHQRHVWMATITPDGVLAATIGADNTLRVWDTHSAHPSTTIRLPDVGTACDLAPLDHQRVLLATASRDGGIELRALRTNTPTESPIPVRNR
ncbi:WD40 repeat domain-containing protein [Nocardia abscessus]|uniref:WD40 repeat domain-containing protein n=1 Tax=Nocardia abscessus TaxID=120957 RepID=UPI0024590B5A|nr:WD40 repeat domain-containing protein [Nocardia abscessus]